MEKTLMLYKPIGLTPLDVITQYKKDHPEYADVKMGYAGRLDPMAEGLLLVLVGDENKKREKYLGLDKEYEIEVLLGVSTDTYDVLGLITAHEDYWDEVEEKVVQALPNFQGDIMQQYPPYSSMTIKGKPLYWWAREGRLHEIELPSAQRKIYSIEQTGLRLVDRSDVIGEVWLKLAAMQKDSFRKDEVIKSWKGFDSSSDQNSLWIMSFTVNCSSGTYMRSLAHDIGEAIGVPALAFSIKRTKIGDF